MHRRTPVCSEFCYACKGPISWKQAVAKAIAVRRWIEEKGADKAAERLSYEIHYGGIFRWMDKGDFDPLVIEVANKLVGLRPDLKFSAFSRNLSALKKLDKKIVRVLSLDASSRELAKKTPADIRLAWLKTDNSPIPGRVSVVFPANHRKGLLGESRECSFAQDERMHCWVCQRCYK